MKIKMRSQKYKTSDKFVGFQMGANCVPPFAYLFLFCYERKLMSSPIYDRHADIIEAFTRSKPINFSRYLDNDGIRASNESSQCLLN